MGLTEELTKDASEKAAEASKIAAKGAAKASKTAAKGIRKGIVLIMDGAARLSEKSVMKALDRKFRKTGDIQYSSSNVSVEELQKSGRVERVDELMLRECMGYFDKYCKEYGVKYSALKTKLPGEDGNEKEGYMIFFEGRNDKLVEDVLRRAVADWRKDMEQAKGAGKGAARAAAEAGKTSVLAKLAFFRNRIKESLNMEQGKGKGKGKAERTRQQDLGR